jgi:uncharacterized membrane protein
MAWWILFLVLTILGWGIYNLFFKALGSSINYFLVLLIIGITQILIALPFVISSYATGNMTASTKGYIFAIIMGILVSIGTIAFFYTFKSGANASIAIPIYTIGALLLGVLGGILIFKEAFTLKMAIGILLGIASIILLALK